MGFRTICIETRSRCSYEGGYLVATCGTETTRVHLSEISSVLFSTSHVFVSGYLLSEFAKQKIPVVFCDEKCLPVAESLPLHGAYNCPAHLKKQLEWSLPAKKQVWKACIEAKIHLQARVLQLMGADRESLILESYAQEVRSGDSTNREAAAAALYFTGLFGSEYTRDQNTWINASLNYGYAILLSRVAREIVADGYLTQMGIFHRGETNQWNLACDFMEPFRPFMDWLMLTAGTDQFDNTMKRVLTDMANHEVTYDDGRYKMGSVICRYVHDCLDVLNREKAIEDVLVYDLP